MTVSGHNTVTMQRQLACQVVSAESGDALVPRLEDQLSGVRGLPEGQPLEVALHAVDREAHLRESQLGLVTEGAQPSPRRWTPPWWAPAGGELSRQFAASTIVGPGSRLSLSSRPVRRGTTDLTTDRKNPEDTKSLKAAICAVCKA